MDSKQWRSRSSAKGARTRSLGAKAHSADASEALVRRDRVDGESEVVPRPRGLERWLPMEPLRLGVHFSPLHSGWPLWDLYKEDPCGNLPHRTPPSPPSHMVHWPSRQGNGRASRVCIPTTTPAAECPKARAGGAVLRKPQDCERTCAVAVGGKSHLARRPHVVE